MRSSRTSSKNFRTDKPMISDLKSVTNRSEISRLKGVRRSKKALNFDKDTFKLKDSKILNQIEEYAKMTYSIHFMGLNDGKLQI